MEHRGTQCSTRVVDSQPTHATPLVGPDRALHCSHDMARSTVIGDPAMFRRPPSRVRMVRTQVLSSIPLSTIPCCQRGILVSYLRRGKSKLQKTCRCPWKVARSAAGNEVGTTCVRVDVPDASPDARIQANVPSSENGLTTLVCSQSNSSSVKTAVAEEDGDQYKIANVSGLTNAASHLDNATFFKTAVPSENGDLYLLLLAEL